MKRNKQGRFIIGNTKYWKLQVVLCHHGAYMFGLCCIHYKIKAVDAMSIMAGDW